MARESTSVRVAKIAGRILAIDATASAKAYIWYGRCAHPTELKWSDIRAIAASALTQHEDHAERKVLRAGRLPRGHRRIKRHKPVVRNGKVRK